MGFFSFLIAVFLLYLYRLATESGASLYSSLVEALNVLAINL